MPPDPLIGRFGRRELLKTIAIGAAAGLPAFAAGGKLKATAINHVSYSSVDYNKTRDFYAGLFGFQVADEDDKQLYLWAGDSLISAKNTPRAIKPFIDHFGLTVEPWNLEALEATLRDRGLTPRVSPNDPHDPTHKAAFVRDLNGYNLQLGSKDLETKPAPVASTAPLKAIGINHISYQSADYKKTRDFYSDLLSAPVTKDDGKQATLWFGDAFMVVRNTPDGGANPVIDHMAWTLADWNKDHVLAVLKERGIQGRPDAAGKSVMMKDLNGYTLQLCSADLEPRP